MRDFRSELTDVKCWDTFTEWMYRSVGVPEDSLLQNREELIGLCEWIETHQIRSYHEVGIWTGRLVNTLHRLFQFERVSCCDLGLAEQYGMPIELEPGVEFFRGDSQSEAYLEWARARGPVDLTFLDAGHTRAALERDFAIHRELGHRYLAFHDICGGLCGTTEVPQFWRSLAGHKLEIVRPHRELGLDHSQMGIGIWWA